MHSLLLSAWREIRWLLRVSRPRFWMYVFGPFLIGIAAAFRAYHDITPQERWRAMIGIVYNIFELFLSFLKNIGHDRSLIIFLVLFIAFIVLLFGYFLFPANLLLYGVNDYFDRDTDKLNPKKDAYEQRLTDVSAPRLLIWIVVINTIWLLALIIFFFQLPFLTPFTIALSISFLIGFIILSMTYSAPPFRFKARPFFDSISNILYIFPGLFAYFFFTPSLSFPLPWLAIAAGSFWCMAMHAYSAVPDIEADTKAGLQTIATKLGAYRTLLVCLVLYILSAIFAAAASSGFVLRYTFLVLGLVYVGMMIISLTRLDKLMPIYKRFPLVNTVVGMSIFLALVLL